jgi:probable addiction module antidote protein
MKKAGTQTFDPAVYLDNEEAMAAYMSEALDTGDPAFIADALGVIARARGMSELARDTGLSREGLYRSLSRDGNPELATIIRVMQSLGLKLTAVPAEGP